MSRFHKFLIADADKKPLMVYGMYQCVNCLALVPPAQLAEALLKETCIEHEDTECNTQTDTECTRRGVTLIKYAAKD